jgi:hypothetical protein
MDFNMIIRALLVIVQVLMLGNLVEAQQSGESCPKKTGRYMLFIDKSGSMQAAFANNKAQIDRFIGHLQPQIGNGSKIKGFYIFQNTAGSTPFIDQVIYMKCPDIDNNTGMLKKKMLIQAYKDSLEVRINRRMSFIRRSFSAVAPESSQRGTDLWSTLEHMSEFFSTKDSGKDAPKVVYYFSDMIESSDGKGRRNFDAKPPKDKQEAEQWGAEDAQKIEKIYNINKQALTGVRVYMTFPESQLESSEKHLMKYYWASLFGKLGIPKVFDTYTAN